MQQLAATIRHNLDQLATTYEQQLCTLDDYAALPAADRLQAAHNALQLVAAGLENHDTALFVRFVRAIAAERLAQGFTITSVQKSLLILTQILEPVLKTVESTLFLTRSMGEAMVAVSEAAWEKSMAAVQEQQTFLRQIIDLNPNLIFVKDRESRFVLGNRALAEMYGTSVDELLGKTDADLGAAPGQAEQFHLDDLEVMDSLQERILPDRTLTDAAGNVHWLQAVKRPLSDADGVARHVLGISTDITRHKLLQQQVQESLERRGRQVQTVTEVAQELAVVPALEDLYARVVTLTKERFGYYHAQIFRHEPAQGAIVLVAGYGEPGRVMLAGGHRLPMGRGVVGAAAATGHAVLASDVGQDPDWVANPHLPRTRGELAVPIKLRDQVLGILDVQSDTPGLLTAEDQLLLEGLCGQIAAAIEATRLRQETEESLRELERLYGAMSQEGWQAARQELEFRGYLFDGHAVAPAEDVWLPEVEQAMQRRALVAPESERGVAVAPLTVRGAFLGALGVEQDPARPLSAEDLELIEAVAEQVAQTLESARLFKETQQTARTLMGERSLLRILIDALPDVVYVKDADSRFLINNRAHLNDLGAATQEEVLGKTDFDIFPPELAAGFHADEQVVVSTGQPLLDREEYVFDDHGDKQWLWTTKIPLFDEHGQVTGLVGIGRDITERKHTQATLERRRAQLQCLSDIGQRIGEGVAVPEFLEWVAGRVPEAMQFPERAVTAIEFEGRVLGQAEAFDRPRQIVQTLHAGGAAVGRICIAYDGEIDFLDEESALLGDISRRVAGYVENRHLFDESRRLFEEARTRAEELNVLNEMSRALTQVLDEEAVLDNVYRHVSRLMPARNFYIALYDEATDSVNFALDYREGEPRPPARRRTGAGLTEYIIHTGEPLLIKRDVAACILQLPGVQMIGATAESWLGVPLLIGGQVLGVMAVQSYTTPGLYTDHHRDLLLAVAGHTAVALQNARLLAEAQARAERELLVRTITDRVRRGMDREAIVRITLQELGQMLGASRSVMRLGTRDQLPIGQTTVDHGGSSLASAADAVSPNSGRGDGNGRRDVG